MLEFVIYVTRGRGPCFGEIVDADPGEDFIVSPGVGITPVVQFFVEPCKQTYRAIRQAIADSLWLRTLLLIVAIAVFKKVLGVREAC